MNQMIKDMTVFGMIFLVSALVAGGIVGAMKYSSVRPDLKGDGFIGLMAQMEDELNLESESDRAELSTRVLVPAVIK